jgi:hypothetical protein
VQIVGHGRLRLREGFARANQSIRGRSWQAISIFEPIELIQLGHQAPLLDQTWCRQVDPPLCIIGRGACVALQSTRRVRGLITVVGQGLLKQFRNARLFVLCLKGSIAHIDDAVASGGAHCMPMVVVPRSRRVPTTRD